jgi:hypothetical protein
MFLTDLTVRYSSQTKEIFCCEHASISTLNGRYVDLFEIEREPERLPCIRKVWVTIFSDKKQNRIGAVYQVDDNAAAFKNISWFERLVTYAKTRLPSCLIPSPWARVEASVDDRNKLTNILLAANSVNKNDQDKTSFSFEYKIQRLVQNTLNLDRLPDLYEDFLPERRTNTLLSYRHVQVLQAEGFKYTHSDLFGHRTLQDVIHYLQQSSSVAKNSNESCD